MAYHLFLVGIDRTWYKTPGLLDEAGFEDVMNTLSWRLPYNMKVYHCSDPAHARTNPVLCKTPARTLDIAGIASKVPEHQLRIKDKLRGVTLPICRRSADDLIAETEDGYGRYYHVPCETCALIAPLFTVPISLREAQDYITEHHRHNAAPKFHKFSVCLRAPGELEPVGVAVASTPKARAQMDGVTLEINRCCADPRYADVCSRLYAQVIRIGREMGYRRFLTYTLPEESGSSLKAVGFQFDGFVPAARNGWDTPGRHRDNAIYPPGPKLRWVKIIRDGGTP